MYGRILLVDAHLESREVYRTVLEWAGYVVVEARTAAEGFSAAANHAISLIVSEVQLPGFDGLRLVRMLKSDARTATIPILILTADGDESERAEALSLGCCGYLQKPCEPVRLLEEVQRHVGSIPIEE